VAQARLPVLRDPEVGGLDLRALLNRFGSPLFIVDSQRLDRQAATLTRMFPPPRYRLYYAVKANPRVAIVRHLMRHGLGCDASGIGDVRSRAARRLQPDAISVTGVGLSRRSLSS
jgi:diaminopimelate decarboxylase